MKLWSQNSAWFQIVSVQVSLNSDDSPNCYRILIEAPGVAIFVANLLAGRQQSESFPPWSCWKVKKVRNDPLKKRPSHCQTTGSRRAIFSDFHRLVYIIHSFDWPTLICIRSVSDGREAAISPTDENRSVWMNSNVNTWTMCQDGDNLCKLGGWL